MKSQNLPPPPDFVVQWENASSNRAEVIYCDSTSAASALSNLRKAIATLHTATTHVEVSEVVWTEPTELTFTPHRLGFCFVTAYSMSIEYGYANNIASSGGLGRILLMLPGREIRSRHTPGMIRSVTCTFDPAYAEGVVGSAVNLSNNQLDNLLDVRSSLLTSILMRLKTEALYPGPISNMVLDSLGHSMLVECAHLLLVGDSTPETEGRLTFRHFATIEKLLSEVSGEAPTVAQLATACGFSERYFAKMFREQTGCTVIEYIKSVNLAKAKAYLLETDLPLKEIAHRLGFSTPGNFSQAFQSATGIPPGKFRKNR